MNPSRDDQSRRMLDLAAGHYEAARADLARVATGSPDHRRRAAARDFREAVLVALLKESPGVYHRYGLAYWVAEGELHRTPTEAFRSQTK